MQMLRRFAFIALLFSIPCSLYAAAYVTVSKSTSYPFPSELLLGAQGAGDYVVHNTYGAPLTLYVVSLPAGAERLKAIDLPAGAPADCGTSSTISLGTGASCTLRIGYAADAIGIKVFDNANPLALLCKTASPSQYCSALPTTTILTAVAPTNETSLQITAGKAHFAPGETTMWDIKNTGNYTANNIRLFLPPHMVTFMTDDSVTACPSLATGATCHLQMRLEPQTPTHGLDAALTLQAGNSGPVYQPIRVYNSLLTISPATFVEPGEAAITLKNNGQLDVTNISIDDVSTVSSIHGVTQVTSKAASAEPPLCTTGGNLKQGESCEFLYSISASSYGQAELNVYFTPGEQPGKTLASGITIEKVQPVINPNSEGVAQPVNFDRDAADKSFIVENNSKFTWYTPKVTYAGTGITLSTDQAGDCSTAGMPDGVPANGGTCKVRYQFNAARPVKSAHDQTITATSTGTVSASGGNSQATAASTSVTGTVTFGPEPQTHIGYTAIKITNGENIALTVYGLTVAPDENPSPVNWCGNLTGQDACDGGYTTASNVCTVGEVLSAKTSTTAGGSCLLWFKGLPENRLTDNTGMNYGENINVVLLDPATGTGFNVGSDWGFFYDYNLYIGGDFTANQNAVQFNDLMKFDGSELAAVANGQELALDGEVDALHFWGGDLFAGGKFSSTDGLPNAGIARWDGSSWHSLGLGINSAKSFDIDAISDNINKLIVGGDYTMKQSGSSVAPTDIGAWDGSQWYAYGGDFSSTGGMIQSIAADSKGNVLIGGNFTGVSGWCPGDTRHLYYLARLSGTCWQPFNNSYQPSNTNTWLDMDNAVYAMLNIPSASSLYVGGSFGKVNIPWNSSFTAAPAQSLTSYSYNGSALGNWTNWVDKNQVSIDGSGPHVNAMAYANGHLYVGGWFDYVDSPVATQVNNTRNVVSLDLNNHNQASVLKGSLDNQVNALVALYDPNTANEPLQVFAGGDFTDRLQMFNGKNWALVKNAISCSIFQSCNVYALALGASVESAGQNTLVTVHALKKPVKYS